MARQLGTSAIKTPHGPHPGSINSKTVARCGEGVVGDRVAFDVLVVLVVAVAFAVALVVVSAEDGAQGGDGFGRCARGIPSPDEPGDPGGDDEDDTPRQGVKSAEHPHDGCRRHEAVDERDDRERQESEVAHGGAAVDDLTSAAETVAVHLARPPDRGDHQHGVCRHQPDCGHPGHHAPGRRQDEQPEGDDDLGDRMRASDPVTHEDVGNAHLAQPAHPVADVAELGDPTEEEHAGDDERGGEQGQRGHSVTLSAPPGSLCPVEVFRHHRAMAEYLDSAGDQLGGSGRGQEPGMSQRSPRSRQPRLTARASMNAV